MNAPGFNLPAMKAFLADLDAQIATTEKLVAQHAGAALVIAPPPPMPAPPPPPADAKKKEESEGRKKYTDTLGNFLGGPLHDAISKALDEKKLGAEANKLVEKNIKGLAEKLKGLEGVSKEGKDAIDELSKILVEEYGKLASEFIKNEGKDLVDAVQGVVDENPILVATMALLAAVVAVVANMKIPELKSKFKLSDNLAVEVAADLGRLQQITLEKLQVKVELELKDLKAKLEAKHSAEEGIEVKADATYKPHKTVTVGVNGGYSEKKGGSAGASVTYKPTDELTLGAKGAYDEKKGGSGGVDVTYKPNKAVTLTGNAAGSQKEGASGGVGVEYKPNDTFGLNATIGGSEKEGAKGSVGVNFKPNANFGIGATVTGSEKKGVDGKIDLNYKPIPKLDINANLGLGTDGKGPKVGAGIDYKPNKDLSIGASVTHDGKETTANVGIKLRF